MRTHINLVHEYILKRLNNDTELPNMFQIRFLPRARKRNKKERKSMCFIQSSFLYFSPIKEDGILPTICTYKKALAKQICTSDRKVPSGQED